MLKRLNNPVPLCLLYFSFDGHPLQLYHTTHPCASQYSRKSFLSLPRATPHMSISGTSKQFKLFCKEIFLKYILFSDLKNRTSHFALSFPDASDVDINSDIWCYNQGCPVELLRGTEPFTLILMVYTQYERETLSCVCVLQIIPPLILHLKLLIFFLLPASSVSLLPLHTCWAEKKKKKNTVLK